MVIATGISVARHEWTVAIGGVWAVTHRAASELLSDAAVAESLVGESVLSLRARKADGELEIRFTHDRVLTVEPDPDYEAWEMYSSRGRARAVHRPIPSE